MDARRGRRGTGRDEPTAPGQAVERVHAATNTLQEESTRIDAELKKTEAAIDRYLAASEDGTMFPAQWCPRLEHFHRLRQLQARRDEIADIEEHQPHGPDREQITALRERLDAALTHGETATVKSVLRELIDSVDVHDERLVQPRFRVPGAVRTRSRLAGSPNGIRTRVPTLRG